MYIVYYEVGVKSNTCPCISVCISDNSLPNAIIRASEKRYAVNTVSRLWVSWGDYRDFARLNAKS